MTETLEENETPKENEPLEEIEPLEESEPLEGQDPLSNIDISTPEGRKVIFEILCMVRGIDPSQVQGMAKFMDAESVDETTYYTTQRTAVSIAQLRLYSESFYKGEEWNEYEFAADILGTSFKGFKGFKSVQYTDITSGQPNLDKLKGLPEETKHGVLSGILGRGKD